MFLHSYITRKLVGELFVRLLHDGNLSWSCFTHYIRLGNSLGSTFTDYCATRKLVGELLTDYCTTGKLVGGVVLPIALRPGNSFGRVLRTVRLISSLGFDI